MEKLTREYQLSESVFFHGWLDNGSPEQLEFLRKASIYVTASRFENCPMSVIEAAASGCYPLLSDIPAHRQLIPEDEYHFVMNDEVQLAQKLQQRINAGICENGVDVTDYTWDNIIMKYEAVLGRA